MPTIAQAIDRTRDAMRGLAALGEEVTDEWQYVTDLEGTWRRRLDQVADARGAETLSAEAAAAIDQLATEAAAVDDPHRAIDWLSTLPQAALLALGEGA
jgi:hypothetical protein